MKPQEFDNLFPGENTGEIFTQEEVDALPPVKFYVGEQLKLRADEDDFDQPICLAGKKKDIDIIILTHIVGSRQVVTEVLDTKDRSDSFGV